MPNPTWDKRAKKREVLIPNPKAKCFDPTREVMRSVTTPANRANLPRLDPTLRALLPRATPVKKAPPGSGGDGDIRETAAKPKPN